MAHLYSHVFEKRETEKATWHGRVGHAEFVIDGNKWMMDGKELPEISVRYLIEYGIRQNLTDAYANGSDLEDGRARWQARYDALVNGTIGVRGSGGGVSDETTAQRYVMKRAYFAQVDDAKKAAFKDMEPADQADLLDRLFAKNAAKLATAVADRLAEMEADRKRRAAERAKLAGMGVDLDL